MSWVSCHSCCIILLLNKKQSGGCKDTDLEVFRFTSMAHKMTIPTELLIYLTAAWLSLIENFPINHW